MNYDFDTPINRSNTNSLKWDVADGELPIWVADMDFKTTPEIIDSVKAKADHGIFGYTLFPTIGTAVLLTGGKRIMALK